MARSLTVVPATLRDASFVMGNLNEADEREVSCQVAAGTIRHELAYAMLMSGDNFAVRDGSQPIAFFGTMALSCCYLNIWALGTKEMWRAVPLITDTMLEHVTQKRAEGYVGMEARSWIGHPTAHKWIEQIGGRQHGEPYEWGRDRELFLTFRWTEDQFESITRKRRRAP